ncbi:MAG: nucleoside 2-deoxyribosyltransferase domain-containing protein [Acidobacteriota bacterium]
MRVLFARQHATIYPGKGIFLAGPTPPDGAMPEGWRRELLERLDARHGLSDDVTVVVPEPEDGRWRSILSKRGARFARTDDDQIAWELQYLELCDVTAFWLPTYWSDEKAGSFPANIGPTTRWEFGFLFQRWLREPSRRRLVVGSPDDAESLGWARHVVRHHGLTWHSLSVKEKNRLVADSFVDALARAVARNEGDGDE